MEITETPKNGEEENDREKKSDSEKLRDIYKRYKFSIWIASFILIGFLIAYFLNYKPNLNHKNLRQELDLLLGNTCYHIHHWIYFSIIIILILIGRYVKNVYIIYLFVALFIGFILEDFLFTGKRSVFKIINTCKLKLKKYMR